MRRVKTSIYIDKDLWERFKRYAARLGMEPSKLLEEMLRNGMIEEAILEIMAKMSGVKDYELDFEPIEPRRGSVSGLVRALRNAEQASVT